MTTDSVSDDDFTNTRANTNQFNVLEIRETGQRIVLGFGSQTVPDDHCLAVYREQIRELIKEHRATEVGFDLEPFKTIQSGTLGLIASIRNEGVKVFVFNVSPGIREVFELTNLDQVINLFDPQSES
jgi:anti-sigma B factor antagonist